MSPSRVDSSAIAALYREAGVDAPPKTRGRLQRFAEDRQAALSELQSAHLRLRSELSVERMAIYRPQALARPRDPNPARVAELEAEIGESALAVARARSLWKIAVGLTRRGAERDRLISSGVESFPHSQAEVQPSDL